MLEDLVAISYFNQAPFLHHRDAVGQDVDNSKIVADEEAGEFQFILKVEQKIEEASLDRNIER